jgi:8-oxo-dGTP diphosphatase
MRSATCGTVKWSVAEELAELAWVAHGEIPEYAPYGVFEPVQEYLDAALTA